MIPPLPKKAPKDKTSPEFIDYLRSSSKVVWENPKWIVVENSKHYTKKRPWLTAFWKGVAIVDRTAGQPNEYHDWYEDVDMLWYAKDFATYEWRKESPMRKGHERFHIHMIKKKEWIT